MQATRRTLELTGAVIFSLFVLVGSGLIVDRAVLMLAAATLAVLPIVFALLTGRWRPRGIAVTPPPRSQQRDGS